MMEERYELAKERLTEIHKEETVKEPYCSYFRRVAFFLLEMSQIYEDIKAGSYFEKSTEELRSANEVLFADVLPELYEESYANPVYAVSMLGDDYGQILSFVYTQMRSVIPEIYEQNLDELVIHMEFFLEVYSSYADQDREPAVQQLKEIVYFFVYDYMEEETVKRVSEKVDPASDFAYRIIMESDLSDERYLYRYGEYITDNQRLTAAYLNNMEPEKLQLMADTYTEGYRIGFIKGNKDLSKKKVAQIVYPIGFEQVVKLAIDNFKKMGLDVTMMRTSHSIFTKRGTSVGGYYSESPNKQYEYDHREDEALFLDKKFVSRRLEVQKEAYEQKKELSAVHAGPAWIEVFGETPFTPVLQKEACQLSKKQQELSTWYYGQLGQIINSYIPGEERSFTIIAYPIPEIGEDFPEIFREIVKINTLDYKKYQKIQQTIIDTLDTCEWVEIKGKGENETDLLIHLHTLTDAKTQTNFENCVADVNIPLGEVFTSPVLAGTGGMLHVSKVYLNGLQFCDLKLVFDCGQVIDYSCSNFETEEENRKYIEDNILFHHPKLAMGEFAIGTNTTAYVAAQKYNIADKLPILIAEKMGPHFAVGDTCYSWSEDTPVYNPDGKEIIARDNEISEMRKEDVSLAYYGCHTDITIPYDELGSIRTIDDEGDMISIIEDGRFVLPGTEALNEPFGE